MYLEVYEKEIACIHVSINIVRGLFACPEPGSGTG
jgi:hypothetical protein